MDFLSFSPSLQDILSLVDYQDIKSCTLVNRRLYHVIRRNRRRLPRPSARIVLDFCVFEEELDEGSKLWGSVDVTLYAELESSFYVRDYCTLIERGQDTQWIMDYYEKKGAPRGKVPADHRVNIYTVANVEAFVTDGVADGLTDLLSLIFDRYHFYSIELTCHRESAPADICILIDDLRRSSLAKCDRLKIGTAYPDEWNGIIEKYNCSSVCFDTTADYLNEYLPLIEVWWRELIFEPETSLSAESLEHIVDIIEEWQCGSISWINRLQIAPKSSTPLNLTAEIVANTAYSGEFSIRYKARRSKAPSVEVRFKRSCDERILLLKYEQLPNRLEISDNAKP